MEQENKKPSEAPEGGKKQSKRFLVVYIIGLFSVALVLILLSYLTQVRANKQLASYQDKINEQMNVAQGAQQQMLVLQSTLEEQQKKLERQDAAIREIREELQVQQDVKVEQAVALLNERYVALDSLQQVRRLADAENEEDAKQLAQKMIERYGAERLLKAVGDDAVLLGQNSVEFRGYCVRFGIAVS